MSLLLLDGASLYFRAFHALPTSMRAPDGTPVNAVRGFLDTLARLLTQTEPQQVACCMDADWRPAWRVELLPTYKAHRVAEQTSGAEDVPDELSPQVPILEACLEALGIPVVSAEGFEADDVIATLASTHGGRSDIVSGDRDLVALVDEHTRLLYTGRSGPWQEFTPERVVEVFGVTPAQYADLAVLRGDPSDGLPGLRGIGEKTATRLVQQYGDLAGVLAAAADPASAITPAVRRALLEGTDYLDRATRVVALVRDVALPELAALAAPADQSALEGLGQRWGLGASMQRVLDARDALGPAGRAD